MAKVDDRCGPADGCGARTGEEIVGRVRSAEGHVKMRVRIDAAGEKQESGRVDDWFGLNWREYRGELP